MAMLKIKNEQGGWDEILAIRGRDGAIQYTAGANIEISPENVISAVGLEGTVTRSDVETMISAAVPTDVSDLTNDAGYITSSDVPTNTSDLTNDSGFITSSSVPTKTSDLTNDSGFITAAQIPAEQEPDFNASVARNITQTDINNWNGKQAPIVFNTAYNSSTNKAATMSDMPYVPTKLSDLTNDSGYALRSELPTVPTKVSDLTNDTGYITSSAIPTKTSDLTNDSNYATLSDIPTVPTKTSDLTNDSGYVTSSSVPTKTSDLTNDSGFITNSALPTKLSDLTNDAGYITTADIPADNVAQGTGTGSRILSYNSTDNRANQEILARGASSVAEGYNTVASGSGSHAEGYNFYTKLSVASASSIGNVTTLRNIINVPYSVVVNTKLLDVSGGVVVTVTAITRNSYYADITVQGPSGWQGSTGTYYVINAAGGASHVEGQDCIAAGSYSHAEGSQTATLGSASHAQGLRCHAIGSCSHAGGCYADAEADYSTAQGYYLINEVEKAILIGCYGELDATNDANTIFAVANGADSSNFNIGMKLVGLNGAGKLYVEGVLMGPDPTTYTGYDATKTQVLKNVQGTFTWVDEV